MAYVKNTWVDQKVQRPKTYNFTTNDDGSTTLIDAFGNVEELGTPVNADNMNHIEDGLANVGIWTYSATVEYNKDDAVIGIVDNEFVLYKSKQDKNKGNNLSDTDYWEEVKLGGSSGLEVCDIGMALFIDEGKGLRRRLNGQIVVANANTQGFIDKLVKIKALVPSLFDTEENWQAIKSASKLGQCGKFVFNYSGAEIVSVRIPAVVNINGLADMANAGLIKDESLPNIKQNLGRVEYANNASIQATIESKAEGYTFRDELYSGDTLAYITFNANNTNSVYKDNAPIQQEAIQYPYFIQIATGQETENNIVNDIELNNPFVLFTSQYTETPLYNLSWLKSDGEYKPKDTYIKPYEALIVEQNTDIEVGTTVDLPSGTKYAKRGLSVKLSTASDITDYDFEINTTNETFRLPLKNHSADDGNSNLNLYYYVGETVQNANLINAGRIGEQIVDLNATYANTYKKTTDNKAICKLLAPDWSAGVALALNTDVTISEVGWVLMQNTIYYSTLYGYVNGIKVFQQRGTANVFEDWNSMMFMVNTGDVVRLDGGELKFFPCKGAV